MFNRGSCQLSLNRVQLDNDQITILEFNPGGHRYEYVAHLVRGAGLAGNNVSLVTTERGRDSKEFLMHLARFIPTGLTVEVVRVPRMIARIESLWVFAMAAWFTRKGRRLIVPDGDRVLPFLIVLALLGWRVSALSMRPNLRRSNSPVAIAKAAFFKISCVAPRLSMHGLVPSLPDESGDELPRGFHVVRDPLPTVDPSVVGLERAAARELLGISAPATVALMPGTLNVRKSPMQVLEWLRYRLETGPAVLVLAGRVEPELKLRLIERIDQLGIPMEAVVMPDRYLSDLDLGLWYRACDLVLALYENIGSSGALAHAVVHGRPVVAWGNQVLCRAVRAYDLGVVLEDRSVEVIDTGLRIVADYVPSLEVQDAVAGISSPDYLFRALVC
jgi:hypothetical protein